MEGKIEVTGRRGRRLKHLLDDLKERRGYRRLKEEALAHSLGNSLWKRLWTCRNTDNGMDEFVLILLGEQCNILPT
jgi:hypothetical protein